MDGERVVDLRYIAADMELPVSGFRVTVGVGVANLSKQFLHILDVIASDCDLCQLRVERYRLQIASYFTLYTNGLTVLGEARIQHKPHHSNLQEIHGVELQLLTAAVHTLDHSLRLGGARNHGNSSQ